MTDKANASPVPMQGGNYVLVDGKLVRMPEPDQQVHASEGATAPKKNKG